MTHKNTKICFLPFLTFGLSFCLLIFDFCCPPSPGGRELEGGGLKNK